MFDAFEQRTHASRTLRHHHLALHARTKVVYRDPETKAETKLVRVECALCATLLFPSVVHQLQSQPLLTPSVSCRRLNLSLTGASPVTGRSRCCNALENVMPPPNGEDAGRVVAGILVTTTDFTRGNREGGGARSTF